MKKIILFVFVLLSSTSYTTLALEDGRYALISRSSGLAIDIQKQSVLNAANVIQWKYWQGENQQFDITATGDGTYSVLAAHSGKSLDVYQFSLLAGGEIRQWDYWGGDNQRWYFDKNAEGYYTITSALSSLALDVWQWNTANGGDIRQWHPTGAHNQQWQLVAVNDISATGNCEATENLVTIDSTIVVSGIDYDGQCQTFVGGPNLQDPQLELASPMFAVTNGGSLRNVYIKSSQPDAITAESGATLENITWEFVNDTALRVLSGDVQLNNLRFMGGLDKFIYVTGQANISIDGCVAQNAPKFLRQASGKTFPINVDATDCTMSNIQESVFRSDSPSATATLRNSTLSGTPNLCVGKWLSCTEENLSYF